MRQRTGRRPGRPLRPNANSVSNARRAVKYFACRALGLDSTEAKRISGNHDGWVKWMREQGQDPEALGVAEKLLGGRPRTDPGNALRYRELRRRGLPAAVASKLSQRPARYELTIRKLDKGLWVG